MKILATMFEVFSSDIVQIFKCFALERLNFSCQTIHTKMKGRLNFNPGLVLITLLTTIGMHVAQTFGYV